MQLMFMFLFPALTLPRNAATVLASSKSAQAILTQLIPVYAAA